MAEHTYEVHDIVQIKLHVRMFGGCLMAVSEVRSWGLQGYVRIPSETPGDAYFRAKWEDIEPTGGKVVFAPPEDE